MAQLLNFRFSNKSSISTVEKQFVYGNDLVVIYKYVGIYYNISDYYVWPSVLLLIKYNIIIKRSVEKKINV